MHISSTDSALHLSPGSIASLHRLLGGIAMRRFGVRLSTLATVMFVVAACSPSSDAGNSRQSESTTSTGAASQATSDGHSVKVRASVAITEDVVRRDVGEACASGSTRVEPVGLQFAIEDFSDDGLADAVAVFSCQTAAGEPNNKALFWLSSRIGPKDLFDTSDTVWIEGLVLDGTQLKVDVSTYEGDALLTYDWNGKEWILSSNEGGQTVDVATEESCAGWDLVELQDGTISGRLASVGIWTNDPNTGEFLGMGAVIDQIWEMGTGGRGSTLEETEASLRGGWLGDDLQYLFGSNQYVLDRVTEGILIKARYQIESCTAS